MVGLPDFFRLLVFVAGGAVEDILELMVKNLVPPRHKSFEDLDGLHLSLLALPGASLCILFAPGGLSLFLVLASTNIEDTYRVRSSNTSSGRDRQESSGIEPRQGPSQGGQNQNSGPSKITTKKCPYCTARRSLHHRLI